jgi:hypothetical protein
MFAGRVVGAALVGVGDISTGGGAGTILSGRVVGAALVGVGDISTGGGAGTMLSGIGVLRRESSNTTWWVCGRVFSSRLVAELSGCGLVRWIFSA